jgi:hypothetical protein
MIMNTFKELVDMAANYDEESTELDCDLSITVDGDVYHAYAVSVAPRELLFYCDGATVEYVIDVYNGVPIAVLNDVIEEE